MKPQKKLSRKHGGVATAPAPAVSSKRWWWYAAGIFALAYAGFQAYGAVLTGPFVFDDAYLPFRRPNFPNDLKIWMSGVRPLLMFSYWLNFQISESDTLWYHIYNVLFHIGSSFLIFLILRKVLSFSALNPAGSPVDEQRNLLVSGFAAGLFLLHPVQTEAVAYVASRSENLSILLFLGAFTLFLYRRTEAVSWTVAIGVLVLYGAAGSVKEHTVALIAVLLLTDYYWNPGFSFAGIRRNWKLYVPVAAGAIVGGLFVWRVLSQATTAGFKMKDLAWYQYFFTQCRAFFLYLRLIFLPVGQNADYQYPISRTITEGGAIFGLIGILVLVGLAIWYRKRYRLASYGFFVYLALLAPTSSFVPIQDAVAERRLYLPMIGMLFMLTELLLHLPLQRKVLAAVLVLVLLISGVVTYQRNHVWTSDVALWQDTVQKSPTNPRAHFQLAYAYHYEMNRCDLAIPEYATVDRLAGSGYDKRYGLLVDWAEAYDCANRPDEALAKLADAAAVERTAHVYVEIGKVNASHGRVPQAIDALATAEKIDPNYAMTYVLRGQLYQSLKIYLKAIDSYQKALSLEPGNQPATAGLSQSQQHLHIQR
jgi:tetratricopeptide (TPR) repeat protein